MPRRKELHWFTRSTDYLSSSFLLDENPAVRLFGPSIRHWRYRKELCKAMASVVRHRSAKQLAWDARFFLSRYHDDWYKSLFPVDRIGGEITPAYALLNDTDVTGLAELLPEIRAIYLIRDPVRRAWSTLRYHESRTGKKLSNGSEDDIVAYLSRETLVARSQFPEVIRRWRKCLSSDRLLLGYYDELKDRPKDLFRRVLEFLGVNDVESPVGRMKVSRVNASRVEKPLPPRIESYLSRQYLPVLEDLADLVDSEYVAAWLDRARATA